MAQLRARLAIFIRERRGAQPQRVFARKTGLAQSTIMRIENQDQNVTLETLEQLCRVFRVDIGELFPPVTTVRAYPGLHPAVTQRPGMVHEREVTAPPVKSAGSRRVRSSTADTSGDKKA